MIELPLESVPEARAGDNLPHGFRLSVDEPLALGVRRIILEQIDNCVLLLRHEPDVDRTAHQMRKALKRARAVLRLVRGELGRFRYREENVVLRDTARRWAPVRDGAVMARTASDLVADTDLLGELPSRRLVSILESRAVAARVAVSGESQIRTDTLTTLLCFRARVARHPVVGEGAFPDRFSSVRPGLSRIAGRTGNGMAAAEAHPTTIRLHEWRKSVKYLRHQVEVLGPVWEDLLDAVAGGLDDLGEVLGDDHDLAVLGNEIATDPELVPDETLRYRALAAIERQRRPLQSDAFALGKAVIAHPTSLVDQIGAAWTYARER